MIFVIMFYLLIFLTVALATAIPKLTEEAPKSLRETLTLIAIVALLVESAGLVLVWTMATAVRQ